MIEQAPTLKTYKISKLKQRLNFKFLTFPLTVIEDNLVLSYQ